MKVEIDGLDVQFTITRHGAFAIASFKHKGNWICFDWEEGMDVSAAIKVEIERIDSIKENEEEWVPPAHDRW